MLDAVLGEVVVTCEKIHWLVNEGEKWLKPEKRSAGIMSFYKSPRVEFHPVGVVREKCDPSVQGFYSFSCLKQTIAWCCSLFAVLEAVQSLECDP